MSVSDKRLAVASYHQGSIVARCRALGLYKLTFPKTMIIADPKGGSPLESLIGAAMAKQLLEQGD